jgi:polyisoprenoid-binding protein YceI
MFHPSETGEPMFRRILLTVVILFSLTLMMACGPAETETTQAPATATEPAAAEPAPTEEPVAEPTAEPAEEPAAEPTAEPTAEAAEEAPAAESDAASGEQATYTVDTTASSVGWYGFRPAGGSESGTVNIAEGQLSFVGAELVEGMVVIDMQSIATDSQSGGMADQLLGHLSSDDFFGVETYPTATLVLKSAEMTEVENQYRVTADLTIKATTKEIEFITDVVADDQTITANAEMIVNRADFDIRYGSGTFFSNLGNDLISDDMELTIVLVATR